MSKLKGMSHADHVELAEILKPVTDALVTAMIFTSGRFGKTSKEAQTLRKALQNYQLAQSLLDDRYHRVTTDAEFMREGHVYYRTARAAMRRKAPVLTLVPRKKEGEC